MSERSELFSLPDLSLPAPGTPKGATTQRSLSWLTFFGETKKVSSRRLLKQCFSPPAGLIEERKSKLPNRESRNKTPHKSNSNTPVLARETQGINQRLEAFSFSLKNPSL